MWTEGGGVGVGVDCGLVAMTKTWGWNEDCGDQSQVT